MDQSASTQMGQPYHGLLMLNDRQTGIPLSEESLQITHTRKVHLFVVDKSLRDYQHIHPTAIGQDGGYSFTFTPKSNQPYTLWAEFVRIGSNEPERVQLDLPYNQPVIPSSPALTPSKSTSVGDIQAQWVESQAHPLQQGKASEILVYLRDKAGNPVTQLEEVMGAKCHMAGFSADGQHFIHAHPMESEDPSLLRFHVMPEHEGMTRFFLQIKQDGQEIYLPFTRMIKGMEKQSDRIAQLPAHSMEMCR